MGFQRLLFSSLAAVALTIGPPRTAAAETAAPYTDQVLIADGASFGVIAASFVLYSQGAEKTGKPLLGMGVVGYAFATPIIHIAHGRFAPAAVSVVLRLLLPLVAIGLAQNANASDGVALGVTAAAIAAPSVLDAAVFARPAARLPPRSPDDPAGTHVESRPRWDVVGFGGAGLGLTYGTGALAVAENGPEHGKTPAAYFVPVVGPAAVMVKTASTYSDVPVVKGIAEVMLAGVALAQAASLAAIVVGFASPEKVTVADTEPAHASIRPFVGAGQAGVAGVF